MQCCVTPPLQHVGWCKPSRSQCLPCGAEHCAQLANCARCDVVLDRGHAPLIGRAVTVHAWRSQQLLPEASSCSRKGWCERVAPGALQIDVGCGSGST